MWRKSTQELFISYSINKEDIAITRVPLSALKMDELERAGVVFSDARLMGSTVSVVNQNGTGNLNATVKLTFEAPVAVPNSLPEHADHFYR
jgi:hypothetical protein